MPVVRAWHDWRWVAAVAGFIASLGIVAFAVSAVENGTLLEEVKHQNTQLQVQTDRLDRNQAGIDELVSFVREIRNRNNREAQSSAQMFVELLCSSEDPIRRAACQKLQETGEVSPDG